MGRRFNDSKLPETGISSHKVLSRLMVTTYFILYSWNIVRISNQNISCFLQTFEIWSVKPRNKFDNSSEISSSKLDLLLDIRWITVFYCRLAKSHGKDYGKPKAGSESDRRSKEYQKNVIQEVVSLCYQISLHGFKWISSRSKKFYWNFISRSKDGKEQILFGDLFKLNEKISNKCVGLLQRARKYRL